MEYGIKTIAEGTLIGVVEDGVRVELDEGVVSFLPNAYMFSFMRVSIGDRIKVRIVSSCPIRNEWVVAMAHTNDTFQKGVNGLRVGDKCTGTIKSVTRYGLWIELPGGIEGLAMYLDFDPKAPGRGKRLYDDWLNNKLNAVADVVIKKINLEKYTILLKLNSIDYLAG